MAIKQKLKTQLVGKRKGKYLVMVDRNPILSSKRSSGLPKLYLADDFVNNLN